MSIGERVLTAAFAVSSAACWLLGLATGDLPWCAAGLTLGAASGVIAASEVKR